MEQDADDGPIIEVIKERYPNGAVRIERETTQDAQGNYVNHGMFKTFNERGALTAQGEYQDGKRIGPWVRWYRSVTDAKLLASQPYQQFAGPFISQATFVDGELDGAWTIYDGRKHKISEWNFKKGRRHGPSTWWLPSGRKLREMNFVEGELDGAWSEWRPDGSLIGKESYTAGRKQSLKSSYHRGGAKKSEGMYLFAKEVEQTPDDWWQCQPMTLTHTGKDERHGPWTAWHPNGQRQQEGTYEHDLQNGPFTWWHSNGQKALHGQFEVGKQNGRWTWWYPSGQKSIQGEYSLGNPTGRWTWWKEDGKVAQSADLSQSEGVAIETPAVPDTKRAAPQAKKPQPRMQIKR
jgi:antitoxin component YwqK of YwqJK toxin-antitoxin module